VSTRLAVVDQTMPWMGTAYHHQGRQLGAGVDCAQLLCAVYEAAGVVGPVDPGNYPRDWHMCRNEERYLWWLTQVGATLVDKPQAGDVAMFRFGRTWSHGGIFVSPTEVVHAYVKSGVILTRLTEEPLASRPQCFFTLPGLN
jgi:cell wall-associated NlpC family hydrolase